MLYWTLNDAAEMAAYLAAGADGFFTDDVPLGCAVLQAAGFPVLASQPPLQDSGGPSVQSDSCREGEKEGEEGSEGCELGGRGKD